ncbi:fluoride efflux transporter CrcB [Brevibacillus centrosporus]|nr:fluoride efflux transporter CrcB [Brevibacillus centrosporus]
MTPTRDVISLVGVSLFSVKNREVLGLGNAIAVMLGGVFGACSRYGLGLLVPTNEGFPVITLLINLSGSMFLAWFFTASSQRIAIHPRLKLAIGTGFTGAFTTFSSFSLETITLIQHDRIFLALLYVLLSMFGGIACAVVGARVASRKERQTEQVKGEI